MGFRTSDGSSEEMGLQNKWWVFRTSDGSSEEMGLQKRWVFRRDGSSEGMGLQKRWVFRRDGSLDFSEAREAYCTSGARQVCEFHYYGAYLSFSALQVHQREQDHEPAVQHHVPLCQRSGGLRHHVLHHIPGLRPAGLPGVRHPGQRLQLFQEQHVCTTTLILSLIWLCSLFFY